MAVMEEARTLDCLPADTLIRAPSRIGDGRWGTLMSNATRQPTQDQSTAECRVVLRIDGKPVTYRVAAWFMFEVKEPEYGSNVQKSV